MWSRRRSRRRSWSKPERASSALAASRLVAAWTQRIGPEQWSTTDQGSNLESSALTNVLLAAGGSSVFAAANDLEHERYQVISLTSADDVVPIDDGSGSVITFAAGDDEAFFIREFADIRELWRGSPFEPAVLIDDARNITALAPAGGCT